MHVDNMTNFDVQKMLDFHNQRQKDNCLLTMLTFRTDSPSNCGIVVVDEDMIIKEFHEKINKPPTNIANGAIYISGETPGNLDGQTNSSNNNNDAFISKFSADGEKQWTRLIGSSEDDYPLRITIGSDGYIYIIGSTEGDLDGETIAGTLD